MFTVDGGELSASLTSRFTPGHKDGCFSYYEQYL